MQIPEFKEGETLAFTSPPEKDIKQLLSFLKVKVVVKQSGAGSKREVLLYGAGADGLKALLLELTPGVTIEHFVAKPDCSQQLWVCGNFALRSVSWAEDLFQELAKGRHRLCVIDGGHHVALRSGAEECVRLARKSKLLTATPKTHLQPSELVSELVQISPGTKFVFTCHMKGQGISRDDRAEYENFPEVVKVMGRTDSPANQKYLLRLIRKLYE
jgi:hypothetical protein